MTEKLSETIEVPAALADPTLSAEAKALYLALAHKPDSVVATNLAPKVLAPQADIDETDVDTAMGELQGAGLISISRNPYIEVLGRKTRILDLGDGSD